MGRNTCAHRGPARAGWYRSTASGCLRRGAAATRADAPGPRPRGGCRPRDRTAARPLARHEAGRSVTWSGPPCCPPTASPGSPVEVPWAACSAGWASLTPGSRVEVERRAHGGPPPDRRLRAAHRRGGAPGGVVGALHAAPRPRPGARPRVDPDRPDGPPARHPARGRAAPGGRRARRTSQPAGRTSPDAASILRWRRLPGGAPQRGRPPRGQRRRGQRPQRLPGPGRRHRHQHAGHGQGGARGGGQGGPGRRRRAHRPGRVVRGADGRPRELGRDHQPDPRRASRPAWSASTGSTAWTSRTPWTSARRPPTRPWPGRSRARS